MSNNSQNFFFVLLSFFIASSTYTMEVTKQFKNAELNKQLWREVKTAISKINDEETFFTLPVEPSEKQVQQLKKMKEESLQKIQKLLRQGANPNSQGKFSRDLCEAIVRYEPTEFVKQVYKLLLKHGANGKNSLFTLVGDPSFVAVHGEEWTKFIIENGADINALNGLCETPLAVALANNNIGAIKILCSNPKIKFIKNAGGENPFHIMQNFTNKQGMQNFKLGIETFLVNACFNSYKAIINQAQQKQLETAMLVLKNLDYRISFPQEIQDQIVAYLPMEYFQEPNSNLCIRLLNQGYKHPYLSAHTNKQIAGLKSLMEEKAKYGKTPLDCLSKSRNKRWMPKYFDPNNGILVTDAKVLKNNPSLLNSVEGKNNLVCQIYKKHEALLENQLSLNRNRIIL